MFRLGFSELMVRPWFYQERAGWQWACRHADSTCSIPAALAAARLVGVKRVERCGNMIQFGVLSWPAYYQDTVKGNFGCCSCHRVAKTCHCHLTPHSMAAATSFYPQTIRIGEERYNYTYQPVPRFLWHWFCWCISSFIGMANASLKPRLREDKGKKFYTCCRSADGWDTVSEGNVLHLVCFADQWVAIHAAPDATFVDIVQQDTGMMAFSTDENILEEGQHTWVVPALLQV